TAVTYSMYSWRGTSQEEFVGLANFVNLFSSEPYRSTLPRAFGHNLLLFVGAMVVQNSVGLLFAVILHRRARFRRFFQVLFTMPYRVSPLVVGYLWSLLLSPLFGPVNAALKAVGLDSLAAVARDAGHRPVGGRPRHRVAVGGLPAPPVRGGP